MKHDENLKGGFPSLGEFLIAVRKYRDGDRHDSRIADLEQKTLTEGTDSAGGFTVPEYWANEIYHAALEESIVRSRAIVLPMTSDTLNVPVLVDSNRSTNIFGGITLTWVEEAEEKSTSAGDPKFGDVKLEAHEGIAFCWVQNQLEDDARSLESFIKTAYGKALAFYEDDVYLHGSGIGRPLGIMPSGGMTTVTRTALGKIDIADFGNLSKRLLPGSWKTAVWLINPMVLGELFELQTAAANSASIINLADMRILGRPIIVTEKCAALNTTGDIILADFDNGYVIGDRSMTIEGSRHANYGGTSGYLQNQTGWRIVLRVAGQPVLSAAITPKRGSNTLSHFVCLSTNS